jgi:hypothetical protein
MVGDLSLVTGRSGRPVQARLWRKHQNVLSIKVQILGSEAQEVRVVVACVKQRNQNHRLWLLLWLTLFA